MTTVDRQLMTEAITLVKADGVLEEEEIEIILQLARKYGFTQDDIQRMASDNPPNTLMAISSEEKIQWIYRLVTIALTDGVLSDDEARVIREVSSKMNMDSDKVERLLNYVREKGTTDLDANAEDELLS